MGAWRLGPGRMCTRAERATRRATRDEAAAAIPDIVIDHEIDRRRADADGGDPAAGRSSKLLPVRSGSQQMCAYEVADAVKMQ